MVITLPPPLQAALTERARQRGVEPEALALEVLTRQFVPASPLVPRDEWERLLLSAATDCGVSLSNEALSREGLYD
ncbi:MAG: hypothetical protein K2P78_12210 [Gemmataceae bacterium]|nr:hypothetical protein [Gemmataceae bacterium]